MADQGQSRGFNWMIGNRPSYATLKVAFGAGGALTSEAGAMVSHSAGLAMSTSLHGGCLGALGKIFAKESLFVTRYQAAQTAYLTLAPTLPGDIAHLAIAAPQRLAAGAYLAHSDGVSISTVFGGCRTLMGGSGLFVLEAAGAGDLFVAGFGALYEVPVNGKFTIDTGHLVAWDAALPYTIRSVGGWKSTLFSGEGLVMEFSGQGRVLCSTRNLSAFVSWLSPWLPA